MFLLAVGAFALGTADVSAVERKPAPTLASLAPPAAAGPLRVLLVDDDWSDNNHTPGDKRLSLSDTVFRQLVADAVGGDAAAWAVETVKPYASGPDLDRLRRYNVVVWYTGSSYGGNPDNSSVLAIEDEKTVRRYLEDVGGVVVLVSPGYASKVLESGSTWEDSKWPFLSEVVGVRGGQGLAQRFLPGVVKAADGNSFDVGRGSASVETQFSWVNPEGAAVVFTTLPAAAKPGAQPVPVGTAFPYGRGRFLYVGFTFENLDPRQLGPAFRYLLGATGISTTAVATATRPLVIGPKVERPVAEVGPANVYVSGTPTTALVKWTVPGATIVNAAPGAPALPQRRTKLPGASTSAATASTLVERLVPNGAPVRLALASPDATRADDPGPLTPGQAVTYRVTLTDARGATGSREATYTSPLPLDPASLTATVQADGSIVLTWPEVPGVAVYQIKVSDSRMSNPVVVRAATQWRSARLDATPRRWTVNSVYEPGGTLTRPDNWPSTESKGTSNVGLPTPRLQFLLLPNGAGSHADAEAHYRTRCSDALMPGSLCTAAGFIRGATNWEDAWANSRERERNTPAAWPVAVFVNTLDLGVGRRVNCTPRQNGKTLCWATSHAGAYAPSGDPKSLSIIIMGDDNAFFASWEWDGGELPEENDFLGPLWWTGSASDVEHSYANHASLRSGAVLDSQGRKGVPHACLSCHGGTYNLATRQVVGASLLPVVPSRIRADRATQEEPIRRINQIILQSGPAPGIVDQIQSLYNGGVNTPGAVANDNAVPSGWSQQPGLYRQVIQPYCGSCHFAQRGPMNFRSWGNVLQNKDAVQRTVCVDFTMPHSEILFRRFWTEGNGVSLPGLLSTSLGFQTCRN